jgi:hypothetical protein
VGAFLTARSKAINSQNCAAGFAKAGLYPFNPEKPLRGGYALPPLAGARQQIPRDPFAGHEVLTSTAALEFFAPKEYHCSAKEAADQFDNDPFTLYQMTRADSKFDTGRLISALPDLYIRSTVQIADGAGGLGRPKEIIERSSWEKGRD